MSDAKKILEMINSVDPADAVRLDEIDALCWCYVYKQEYVGHRRIDPVWKTVCHVPKHDNENGLQVGFKWADCASVAAWAKEYTRSRDALKAIRPEGYTLSLNTIVLMANWESYATLTEAGGGYQTKPECLPTEELAELYAVIQCIEYERANR